MGTLINDKFPPIEQQVPGLRCFVYETSTDSLVPLYSDPQLTNMVANPATADENGQIKNCFTIDGIYRVVFRDAHDNVVAESDNLEVISPNLSAISHLLADVASLLTDENLAYDQSNQNKATSGTFVSVVEGSFVYKIAPAGASDHHVETAGGVKLYVLAGEVGLNPRAFGAVNDGIADDTMAVQAADTLARESGQPLVLQGVFRTTQTLRLTAQTIITNDVRIVKDLDDTPVVRFQGGNYGGIGRFQEHRGRLYVSQSNLPSASQTSAHGIVVEDIIFAKFDHLEARRCAYGLKNDATGGALGGEFWLNTIDKLVVRGCIQGFMDLPFSGSGAHTELYIAAAYFNGKEWDNPTILPMQDAPIRVSNMEGLVFGTLNLEHCEVASGGHFFQVRNDSTIKISAFHFEGNQKTDTGSHGIFYVLNGGTWRGNIHIGNAHLNNNTQNAGTLSMFFAETAAHGVGHVGSFSGGYSTNSFSDFRLLDTDGNFTCVVDPGSGWKEYFTSVRKGASSVNLRPNIWIANQSYEDGNSISDPGSVLNLGEAARVRLVGTSTSDIVTIDAAPRDGEFAREIDIHNTTNASIQIVSTGNVRKPDCYSWPISITSKGRAKLTYNFVNNKAEIISVT